MSARARLARTGLPAGAVSGTRSLELTDGWTLVGTEPGAVRAPADLSDDADWRPAVVPGTVAGSLGPDDLDRHADYDGRDWWYRCSVPGDAFGLGRDGRPQLRLDGLATLAEVWLNGERILESKDMFCAYEVDVGDLVTEQNELAICFRSLGSALSERRPRPRWKTRLVENQQLRWFRTTLLGRIPGWTPAIAPVGPWRSVWAQAIAAVDIEALDLRASLAGGRGVVRCQGSFVPAIEGLELTGATLHVGEHSFDLSVEGRTVRGSARVTDPQLWWPRTHGTPSLYTCRLDLTTSAGPVSVDCGRIGFRELEVDTTDGRIQFVVNGVPVFCRGSCWTTNDIVSLTGDESRMRGILGLLADANGNMVRVGGTMTYETDGFYEACDELGLMVWQDFMFANMDYPFEDADFEEVARSEVDGQIRRLARHPSVVAFCGGSEIEQQASMFGADRDVWCSAFFSKTVPDILDVAAPELPYWSSTPTGGVLPFHVGEGLSHYYGVGAYRRPLDDVRLAGVKFTPECLGFSNVPEADNLRRLTPAGSVPPHHPAWKSGVPRDTGPGWDFEDVRDYYLGQLYHVDPIALRSDDLDRYLALSRIVTGEVMAHAFAEWRRTTDVCGGALTWFLNDLRPGAGWGLIDSDGRPKAVLHHLRRAWAPICVRLLDRGLDGLLALAVNATGDRLDAVLETIVLAGGGRPLAEVRSDLVLEPRSSTETSIERLLGRFADPTYSYRFGPLRHEAVVARLVTPDGEVLSEHVYRPRRASMTTVASVGARVRAADHGGLSLELTSDSILYDVRIDVRDHLPDDDHFCLTPGRARVVELRRVEDSGRTFQGYVEALNLSEAVRLDAPG